MELIASPCRDELIGTSLPVLAFFCVVAVSEDSLALNVLLVLLLNVIRVAEVLTDGSSLTNITSCFVIRIAL